MRRRRVRLEPLEDRRLLALLGITPGFPLISANQTGTVSYDASTNQFVATATPDLFLESETSLPQSLVFPPSGLSLQFEVDESGNVVPAASGNDFTLSGSIDIDGDFIFDVTGTLLTGRVVDFGFLDSGPGVGDTTDFYDVRLEVTGGALAVEGPLTAGGTHPAYYEGSDIGIAIDSEFSSFSGDFNVSFGGGHKSRIGPIEKVGDPAIDLEKFTRVDVNPIDIEKLVRVESPAIQGNLCDVLGKPVSLSFQYIPSSDFNPLQPSGKAEELVNIGLDDDGTSFVVVAKNNDPNNFGTVFFQGEVSENDLFTASGDFGSNTYFFFFDEQGGPLLQSFSYHTSCSAPIILGAQPLSATLVGYNDGTPGGNVEAPDLGPGVGDDDADTPTGPTASPGDTVVFTYVVTNPIDDGTGLSGVVVTDAILWPTPAQATVTAVVDDMGNNVGDDGDNVLEFGEAWLYTSTVDITDMTQLGLHIDKATVEAKTNAGATVMDMDPAHFVVASPPLGDVCDVLGDPVSLTFEYIPGTAVDTDQDPGKAEILFDGVDDGDNASYIIVTDKEDASKAFNGEGKQFFFGNVDKFDPFTATGDFGSTTFIHFYDDDNANDGLELLQSIEYHTSCSQPIRLGDVIGNATLVAYDGVNGSAMLPDPPPDPPDFDFGGVMLTTDNPFDETNIGDDADTKTGPLAQLGDKITWTYQVTNTGAVPLSIISLFDDNETAPTPPDGLGDDFTPAAVLADDGYNVGDTDLNGTKGVLDPGEIWFYQAMEIATEPGQHKNTAKVKAVDVSDPNIMVMDDDMSHHIVNPLVFEKYVSVPTPPSNEDQCDINGKVVTLTFDYLRGTDVLTGQDSGKATAMGTPDDDNEAYIVVGGGNLFEGTVLDGEVFTLSGSFGSNTVFEIYDDLAAFDAGADPLQTLQYHTSCSQPIQLGDVIGSVVLVGYQGETGSETMETGLGDPADSPNGPVVLAGDEVVFNYEVINTSSEPNEVYLTDVLVFDSVLGSITEIVDKGDGDDILGPGEKWILTASMVATDPGQQFNLGTVTATGTTTGTLPEPLTASDGAYHFVESLKFFVVDKSDDAAYTYTDGGSSIGSFGLDKVDPLKNDDPRGASSNQAGDKLWVIDKDRFVYVYENEGTPIGAWKAKDIGGEAEGIAVAPNGDIWIVDRNEKEVFLFKNAAGRTSGEFDSDDSFSLNLDDKVDTKNDHPKGITTDGTFLWVVDDDGGTEKVFVYSALDATLGDLLGSWEIGDTALEEPRGITIDPTGGDTIWIVDKKSDKVYQFDNATGITSGTETSDAMFALAGENNDPEGIADPPPALTLGRLALPTGRPPESTYSILAGPNHVANDDDDDSQDQLEDASTTIFDDAASRARLIADFGVSRPDLATDPLEIRLETNRQEEVDLLFAELGRDLAPRFDR